MELTASIGGKSWYAPRGGTPGKIRRGGPEVELNPKPKKVPILGQYGALKIYIYIKHGTLKNIAFFLYRSSFTDSHTSH